MVFFMFTVNILLLIFIQLLVSFFVNSIGLTYSREVFFSNVMHVFKKNIRLNVLYLVLILWLFFINTVASVITGLTLLVVATYILSNYRWLYVHIKEPLKSDYTEGGWSNLFKGLSKLFLDYGKSKFDNFKQLLKDSKLDFEVAFGFSTPDLKLRESIRRRLNEKSKLFLFRKFNIDEDILKGKTEEEVREIMRRIKILTDPNVKFNMLQRLPWKFKHTYNNDFFVREITSQFLVFYAFVKTTVLAVFLSALYFLYTIFFFKIQFLKQLSVWFVIGIMYFWLMSGFNFFVKRYQFGKFTSQIQRFWKRTNTCFWLIEGFLMLLFFYYYLNSSQEPLYMYDYSALNQEYLISLYTVGLNIILLSVVIYFMYFIMLRLSSNNWSQINLYLILVSVFIFFSFFIETYQFYYVISVFNERLWIFNEEENMWGIDVDSPILRTKHQYLLVCLIAKYWHFLFIFLSWIFFLIKSFERKSVTYVLFGANLQNMIILYVLNFACYLQWFKWIYRRFFDLPYTWFFFNIDNKFFFKMFFELKLLALNIFNHNSSYTLITNLYYKSFILWNVDSLAIWKFI